jgi:MFS family permease
VTVRHLFLLAFIPGAVTIFIAAFVVRDIPRPPQPHLRMLRSLRELPRAFWTYVAAAGVFGLGNFAHTLLVLHAVRELTPAYGEVFAGRAGIGLFIFHNVLYAAVSYPAGALGDRVDKRRFLALGYALFGLMCLGFLVVGSNWIGLAVLFALAGTYIGIVDAMQRALAADLLPRPLLATGYGALATVNSFGDLLSSIIVGLLWSEVSSAAGFWYAAVLTLLGAAALLALPGKPPQPQTPYSPPAPGPSLAPFRTDADKDPTVRGQ